ncbi:MAG: phosphatidylserine decarboxylase [Candidatus Sumerlaeia bacterium]|nr:phosphatidylserine decarboxylase [Candidatus Sumerlaeia bacterium]
MMQHQYIERTSGAVRTERLFKDKVVRTIYSDVREKAPFLLNALTAGWTTDLIAFVTYDFPAVRWVAGNQKFLDELKLDYSECIQPIEWFDTPRKVFERQIRYWECRPMPEDEGVAVSPADSRVIVGSFAETSSVFLKDKFFTQAELLGRERWRDRFADGDFAVCRLTPDKYHYNHSPVSGVVEDFYAVEGAYHACNPTAIVTVGDTYSKNRRVVTIIDTDVEGGSRMGKVALIEIVALMIGDVKQSYSDEKYDAPRDVAPGLFMKRGQPKSLYRPGSSTDIVVFERGRVAFEPDIVANMRRTDAESRFSLGFGQPLVETELNVRSAIARRL